jgi:hypothetical protein
VDSKRWSCQEFRDELKAKFAHLLSGEEGISLREARGDLQRLSQTQLREIYDLVQARISDSEDASVGLALVIEEIDVQDILPTLADNARKAREERKRQI